MRKSFTRLFSIFVLLLGLSFQMAYGIVFVPASSVPTDGNSNAKPADFATKFVVAFDVVPVISDAGGTAVIYKNGGLFKTFPVTKTSANVVVVGKTLEITHGIASFAQGDSYSVAITNGAITDLPDGALANGVFDFVVGDYVAPVLSSTVAAYAPLKGAVGVMANLDGSSFVITVPFSEAVKAAAVPGDKAVYVYKTDGTVVDIVKVSTLVIPGAGSANISVPVASTSIFQENTQYYVSIDAGAFVDASPNSNVFGGLAAVTTWTFTTRDYSAPSISADVSNITTTAAKLNVSLTEKGKYYYLLQTEATADPANAAAVKAAGVAVNVTAANTVVTSNLVLVGSTSYEVFVVSENAETPANLSSAVVKKTFSSIDATAPLSLTRGLINTSAKKTSGVFMVFNEQIKGGAGTLDLRLSSNESYVKQIGANELTSRKITAAEVTANTFKTLTYTPTANDWVTVVDFGMTLPSKIAYYVVFPSGYIKDLSDNVFVGGTFGNPINKGDWGITSSDFELPTVAVAFATPASLASDITVTFNEVIQKQLATVTDWASVLALEVNNVSVPFTVTAPALAGNGTVIVIHPTSSLTSNTTYTVRLRANAVKDLSDNAIVTENIYTVTTGDLDGFVAQYGSSVGATATTNLVANSTMQIDFNKAVKVNTTAAIWADATAANLTPFITFKKAGTAKPFTVAYDAATFTVTIIPTDALASNAADYTVELDGAKVKDATGALLSGIGSYMASQTYAIRDFEAPVVTLSNSGNVSSLADPTITITDANQLTISGVIGTAGLLDIVTFKEASSNGANLAFTASYVAATGVLTVTPTIPLAVGKTYYYGLGASLKDGNGNITTGKYATFTIVAPSVAPTIVANTYTVNGSAQTVVADKLVNIVAKSGNIVTVTVTFNDNVKEKFVSNTITLSDGVNSWNSTIVATNVSGNTLTADFNGVTLASDALCTLTLPAGLVQGSTAYTNTPVPTFAQFGAKNILFNAKDIVAPVVTANTPAAGAGAIALNTALKLDFNEKVVLGSGNIVIKKGAVVVQTIAVNSSNVTLNDAGTQATVVKADLLDYFTVYTVEVAVGAFKDDISLNPNALTSFIFTTLLNPQPATSALSPADGSDLVALSPLTLGMTFSEDVVKYDPLIGTRKLWYLVKEGNLGIRATFNGSNDFQLNAGNDIVVANNYIETASVGISGNVVSISTGFTPVAGERYYVLITPGSFLDKSTGNSSGVNPVAGVFAGVTDATAWNFTTKDENAGVVTFVYTKRADDKVTVTSNITINFTRPIKKADGSAINDVDVANLFVLTKTAGPVTGAAIKAFIGTISLDKKTVTILNSSLVTLGEMTALSTYTIGMVPASILYQNGSAVAGAFDTFNTSDYTAPAVSATIADAIVDVKKDEATIQFAATDNTLLNTIYYTIQPGDNTTAAPAAAVVKADKMQAVTGVADAKSFKFTGLTEETSYVVWAVAVDKAGNESAISKVVFTTDDVTKPVLASKPANFDAAGKLTFTFSEAVSPVAGSVKIFDAASMTQLAVLGLNAVPTKPAQLITDAFAPAITNALVNYYVEIDKGLVGDVPVVAGDAVNYFDGLFRIDLMVTSKDVTPPTAPVVSFVKSATDPSKYSVKLVFNEAVKKADLLPANAAVITLAGAVPFEVVDPANIVTDGTSTVMINISRNLASTTAYNFTLVAGSFTDLAGNITPGATGSLLTTDFVAPTVVFAPANNATAIPAVITPLTLTFNEAIRLLDNSAIDSYDLDSLVYLKKDAAAIAFSAAIDVTNKVITITPAATLVKDATYTFGFKAKFEDASDNAVAANAATFKTETTTVAAQYLSWTPVKNTTTSPWLGTSDPITLNFTSPVFTLRPVAAANNLPVTSAYLSTTALVVYKDGVAMAASDLIFTVVDNKTFTVAPKTNWGSSSVIKVEVVGLTLQVNEGNGIQLDGSPFDASTYKAQDIIAPTVVTYVPVKVGLAGVSPVIPKTSALQLVFNEDVKVGTGTYEIHSGDGVLVASGLVTVADDKRTATLGSLSSLPTNQEYYAIVNSGVVVDVTDNNPYAGLIDVKVWKFKLMDDAVPQVVSYLPNTDNQPVNTKLTINFDRPIAITGAGYVALYKSAAGGDAIQIWRGADNAGTHAFTVSGNTITVNILPLDVNTKYFVEVAGGTFRSTTDVVANQAIARADWSFTTEVNANPTLVAQVPAVNANGMSLDQDLQMTFDMPVEAGSGNIQLHSTDGSLVLNFDVKGADVTFANEVVTVALPKLAEAKQFYVIIPATAIRNKTYSPEYFAGVTVPYDWKFNTGDFTAPTVTANPAEGNALPLTFNVTLTFSEKVTGVSATTLTVSKGTINSVSTEATGAIYVANITAASLAEVILTVPATVKDVAGNALTVTKFTYKVDNFDAPKLVSWTPADGSIGLTNDTTLVMTFDKPVLAGTGKISLYNSLSELFKSYTLTAANIVGSKVTVPVKGLKDLTTYIVLLEAGTVKDALGLPSAALTDPTVWNFEVGDHVAPLLVAHTPTLTTALTDNTPTFKLTFDENVKLGAGGNLVIYKVGTTVAALTIPITATMVAGKEVTVTYIAAKGLERDANYYVLVDGKALTDNSGNKFIGVSGVATWTFKTGPNYPTGTIDINNSSEFKVYPNPFVDVISLTNASLLSKVVVTNIAGQVVKEVVNPTNSIELNELRSGIYFISLFDMDNVIAKTAKIVKR